MGQVETAVVADVFSSKKSQLWTAEPSLLGHTTPPSTVDFFVL